MRYLMKIDKRFNRLYQTTDKQRARYGVHVRGSSLGAFANLRKVTISFVVSVCPFVHPSA